MPVNMTFKQLLARLSNAKEAYYEYSIIDNITDNSFRAGDEVFDSQSLSIDNIILIHNELIELDINDERFSIVLFNA